MNINVITEDTKQEKYSKTTSGKTRTVNQVTKDTSRPAQISPLNYAPPPDNFQTGILLLYAHP